MTETKDHEKLLTTARDRFKAACEAESAQRKRETEDLRFQIPELQWTDEAKKARSGDGQTPARPILSISLIQQPIQLVKNQAAAADLGVNIHPVSEKANKEVAEVKQGLYRRIERDSNAEQVRLWALDRATQCGRGWYRITTQYDEDGDNPFDQEIVLKRILHQDSVYMDPSAQEPDCRDANWAFQVSWVSLDDFKREYPNSKAAKAQGASDWEWLDKEAPEWTKDTDTERAVLVAEYWRKIKTKATIYDLEDQNVLEPVPEEELDGREYRAKRTKETVKLCWYKISGFEVLEEQELDVRWIPLIPVYGRELQPFDSERRFEGMIRPAMDGQRLYNFAASTLVERMALEPKTPFIGVEGQFEGHEAQWKLINSRNFPYVEYKPKDYMGQPAPPPQRAQIDQTGMSLAMMALQEGKGFVQSSTAVYDPSLGETPKRGQSGRAVIAQQQQSDAGTSNYLQNLASISMPYEALVILDWMPKVYDRAGRVVQILGDEDQEKTVMLNAPFVPGQDGRPMPVQPGMMPPQAKTFNLSEGKYAISVTIGKSYQTRLQQGQEDLSQLLQSLPPELQVLLLPTYMRFRDTPGADEVSKLLTKYRDSKFPGLADDDNEQPDAEQLQAKIQGMQHAGQQLQQQLQAAAEEIKTDKAKQQAQIQIAQINADKDLKLQAMRDATSIAVAEINARAKGVLSAQEAEHEAIALNEEQAHEVGMQAMDLAHQQQQIQQGQAHDAGMASQQQAFQEAQDASGQAHEAEMAQLPPPVDPNALAPGEGATE